MVSYCFPDKLADTAGSVANAQDEPKKNAGESTIPVTKPFGVPATRAYTAVYPLDAVADSAGVVWIVDRNLPGVWKYSEGTLSVTIEGGKRIREPLNACRCLAMSPDQLLYIGDTSTREVYRQSKEGNLEKTVQGQIGIPVDLAFASDGTLYIADLESRGIWKLKKDATSAELFIPKANARGLYVDSKNQLWVVSQNAEQLVRYSEQGSAAVIIGDRKMEFPHQILVDEGGNAWISDGYRKSIWKVEEGKAPEEAIKSDLLKNPVGLFWIPPAKSNDATAADSAPNAEANGSPAIGIVDPHAMAVFRVNASGVVEPWFEIKKP